MTNTYPTVTTGEGAFFQNGSFFTSSTLFSNLIVANSSIIEGRTSISASREITTVGDDTNVYVEGASAAVEVILPLLNGSSPITQGRIIRVIDADGQSPTYNITISAKSGNTIEGQSSIVLSQAFSSITLQSSGTVWHILGGSFNNGTSNTVPLFTGAYTIGNSIITAPSAGNITIAGNTSVNNNLNVTGNVAVDTNTFVVDATNNRVGVNKASPAVALDVVGAIASSTDVTVGDNLTVTGNVAVDTNTFVVDAVNNRVGVNTIIPKTPIHVNSVSTAGVSSWNNISGLRVGGYYTGSESTGVHLSIGAYVSNYSWVQSFEDSDVGGSTGSTKPFILQPGGGNVGIGVVSPTVALDVVGAIASSASIAVGDNLTVTGNVAVDTNTFVVDAVNNRVGVNKTSPAVALDVVGAIASSTDVTVGDNLTVTGNVAVDTSTFVVDAANNRVGVNKASPAVALDVVGAITSSTDVTVGDNLTVTGNVAVDTSTFVVDATNNRVGVNKASPAVALDVVGAIASSASIAVGDNLTVTGNVAVDTSTFVVDAANNRVGVGISNPTEALHVVGNLYVQGNISAQGNLTYIDTNVTITDQFEVNNAGTGPALIVNQCGSEAIADFRDESVSIMYLADGGNIGMGTTIPKTALHVNSVSTTGVSGWNNQSGLRIGGYYTGSTSTGVHLSLGSYNGNYSWVQAFEDSDVGGTTGSTKPFILQPGGGNVGVGTTNPTSTLHVDGSVSKTSGSFDIEHPLHEGTTRRLVHSFIEGPRCDLIYRNRVQLVDGRAIIDIEKESTGNGSTMEPGTFVKLCQNPQIYLQNNENWERVKGSISNNILTIESENPSSNVRIDWMVIAERADTAIKNWNRTDENGMLILEYNS